MSILNVKSLPGYIDILYTLAENSDSNKYYLLKMDSQCHLVAYYSWPGDHSFSPSRLEELTKEDIAHLDGLGVCIADKAQLAAFKATMF